MYGVVLFVTQVFQNMQLAARTHQRAPVDKARIGFEQLSLPVLELLGEFLAHVDVAVDHGVDHAQHQVGRAGGHAVARRDTVHAELGIAQSALDEVCGGVTAAWVHADEQPVKHHKPHRLGVDAIEGGHAPAGLDVRLAALPVVELDGGFLLAVQPCFKRRGQSPENNQVVNGGVVVVGAMARVAQVLAVQVQQHGAAQLLGRLLQQGLQGLDFGAVQKHPDKTVRRRLRRQGV